MLLIIIFLILLCQYEKVSSQKIDCDAFDGFPGNAEGNCAQCTVQPECVACREFTYLNCRPVCHQYTYWEYVLIFSFVCRHRVVVR
jgi:hypothetical protein